MGTGASAGLVEMIGKSSVVEIQEVLGRLKHENLFKLQDALKQCSEMSSSSEVKLKMLAADGQPIYCDAKLEERFGTLKQRLAHQLGLADGTSIKLLANDTVLDDSQQVAEVEGIELQLVVTSATFQTIALPFLAVGRMKDATPLASYAVTEALQYASMDLTETEQVFKKLLAASQQKLEPAQRTRLQWNAGSVCCLMSENGSLLCCVVTSSVEYPEKFAYRLLEELMQSVQQCGRYDEAPENGMTDALQATMRELVVKFELDTYERQHVINASIETSTSSAVQLKILTVAGQTVYCDAKPEECVHVVKQRLASQFGLADGGDSIKLLSGETMLVDSQRVAEVEGIDLQLVVIPALQTKALPFLAVGRVKDAIPLASYAVTEALQYASMDLLKTREIFKKVLAASEQKLKPAQRTWLQWNAGSVCCLMSENGSLLCCVVTSSMEYPKKFAYDLLEELMHSVQQCGGYNEAPEDGMTSALQEKMRELLLKYEEKDGACLW